MGSILFDVYTLGQNYDVCVKMCIGLAPLYKIGPRSDGGGQTEGQSQENFFGWTEGRTADKKRSKTLILGSPNNQLVLLHNFKLVSKIAAPTLMCLPCTI